MPRRGRSASPPPRRAAAPPPRQAPAPVRASPPATVPHQQTQPMMAPAPSQGPGLLGQMAATAGGVAIGSTVGHVIGHAITGGGGGGSAAAAEAAPAPSSAPYQQQPQQWQQQQQQQQPEGACSWEMKQFLQCAQTQGDLTLCEGFNEALRQCRQYNGINP